MLHFPARATIALMLAAAAVFAPAAEAASTFCGGGALDCIDPPMSGAVTPTSAMVWVHLGSAGQVRVRYEKTKTNSWMKTDFASTTADSDNTARFALAGLKSGTTYAYQVGITQADGSETWSASSYLRTVAAEPTTVSFSVLADFSNKLKASPALASATSQANDFLVLIGDLDHRNPATDPDAGALYPPGSPVVLANMRSMHQNTRNPDYAIGTDFYNGLLASTLDHPQTPLYYAWDDHDYCSNNQGVACPSRDTAVQTYRENYLWAADSAMNMGPTCSGDFQHFTYGKLVDVIMLDARSNRDMTISPPTMLGTCQLNWLLDTLKNATGTWKFVMSPVPFNTTSKTYDSWGAFPAEHQQILDAISANRIKNVIVLSGDIHSGGAYDDGTHSGLPEFNVPHANMPLTWVNTYCEYNKQGGPMNNQPGTWTIGTLTAPNTVPATTCLGDTRADTLAKTKTGPPYPLDGVTNPGYVRIELKKKTATVKVMSSSGRVRTGVYADGTDASLSMKFQAK